MSSLDGLQMDLRAAFLRWQKMLHIKKKGGNNSRKKVAEHFYLWRRKEYGYGSHSEAWSKGFSQAQQT